MILYAVKDTEFMGSLLYYFGVLTLTDQYTPVGELIFKIPNLVIRRLYVERIQEMLLPEASGVDEAKRVARIFYQSGDMQPLCDFMEQKYFKVFDNRDYRWTNELTVKTAFLTLLFNDTFYIMDSETALERGYADMTMIVRPDMRQFELLDFLIEFKYVGLGKNNLTGQQVKQMSDEDLSALTPVQQAFADSKRKLVGYRDTLQEAYGDKLRL
ncbi:MAG: AAA family ATPase, partial [Planctomycetes bacterium]|nr:AAA family ATPase [Planctomycetota bacterium]